MTLVIVACLLILGSILALASKEFESPKRKAIEIKSQEELVSLANRLN